MKANDIAVTPHATTMTDSLHLLERQAVVARKHLCSARLDSHHRGAPTLTSTMLEGIWNVESARVGQTSAMCSARTTTVSEKEARTPQEEHRAAQPVDDL